MAVAEQSPVQKGAYQPVTWNFKLIAQHALDGFGGMGEGMSIQIAPDGRRILWLAHGSAPKNFTAVEVSDPRKPHVGAATAGVELFDISGAEKPRSISFFDCSGATSRGVHQLWFCDGEYVHCASGSRDFVPTHPSDDQFYRCVDVRNPPHPAGAA